MSKDIRLPSPCFMQKNENIKNNTKTTNNFLMPGLMPTGYVQDQLKKQSDFKEPEVPPKANLQRWQKQPHFSSPQGMLMPKGMQLPPMYGPRGSTIPPKYLKENKDIDVKICKVMWCDICDEEFHCEAEFVAHKESHKICGIDGCIFKGEAAILLNHIENTHSNGLYSKIKKLSTPEDIAKWREERRKRYPTRANVELRQKAQQERMKRGEKIEKNKSRFGNKYDRRPIRSNEGKDQTKKQSKPNKRRNSKRENNKIKENKIVKVLSTNEKTTEELHKGKVSHFAGTSNLQDYIRPGQPTKKLNTLASILSAYAYDTESENDSDHEDFSMQNVQILEEPNYMTPMKDHATISETISPENEKTVRHPVEVTTSPTHNVTNDCDSLSDGELPEELPIQRIVESDCSNQNEPQEKSEMKSEDVASLSKCFENSQSKGRHRKRRNRGNDEADFPEEDPQPVKKCLLDYSKLRRTRQNTMLEKLLEADIVHERNVMLQCVRFVVENDFFGIGKM